MKKQKLKTVTRAPSSATEGEFFVEGLSAVGEFLRHAPRSVQRIDIRAREATNVLKHLAAIAPDHQLPIREISDLTCQIQALVRVKAHEFEAWLTTNSHHPEYDLIIAIDHITDPRNLGAIVRTAAFFGVRAVLVPDRRQVLLTGASVATAQGGFALVPLVTCTNLSRALESLKQHGYWVVGTAGDGEPMQNYVGKFERMVLVLGAEDKGLSQNVRRHSDCVVAIPGAADRVESLNVSVAAGILVQAFKAPQPLSL